MTKGAVLKAVLAGTGVIGLALGIADCSHRDAHARVGSVELGLKLASGAQINTVDYLIAGNGILPITGSLDVSKFNTVTKLIVGIPSGKGYTVELDAKSVDEKVTCSGSTAVDVINGMTAEAHVVMMCSDTKGTGSVAITGRLDNCPMISSYSATPSSAPIGGTISLQGKGLDLDGDPLTYKWTQTPDVGDLVPVQNGYAPATLTCTKGGTTTLTFSGDDGACIDKITLVVSCGIGGSGGSSGNPAGGAPGLGTGGLGNGGSFAGQTGGGIPGAGGQGTAAATGGAGGAATGSGGMIVVGASTGGLTGMGGAGPLSGTGGTTGSGGVPGTSSTGGAIGSTGGVMGAGGTSACAPTHCAGAACDACTSVNAAPGDEGCDVITDPLDKKLCEDLYACFSSPASACLREGGSGDPLGCWCGTNPTTCVTSNSPPTQANGPCLSLVFAAAKSTDAATIKDRFVNSAYPLGRAVNLISSRGNWCSLECGIRP